jgi:hypothetical protein
VHTTEEVVRAGRGGERGGLRALAKRRPRRAAHRVVDLCRLLLHNAQRRVHALR